MKKEYIEMFGKKYLKCTSCDHYNSGRCNLFECSCGDSDGCTENHIKQAEQRQ